VYSANGEQVITLSSSSFQQALKVTFDVRTMWYQWYWTADIQIWNPNEQLTDFLLSQGNTSANPAPVVANSATPTAGPIQQGMRVTLSAGYQSPGVSSVVWDGFVLQPTFDRVNQTDFVVTLHCVIGLDENSRNSLGLTFKAQTDQLAIVQAMAAKCFHPLTSNFVAPGLAGKSFSRAKTVFGKPGKYFTEMARGNNMQWFLGPRGLFNVGDLSKNFPSMPKYTFQAAGTTPSAAGNICSIIGTPQQTQFGVNCRLLLNPNVIVSNPPMAIAIDNTVIAQLQRTIGDLSSTSILSQGGVYVVVGARYIGDTRGQDWYTDVTGWLTSYDKVAAIAAATGVQFARP
jgi:hypothetical protein